MFTVLEFELCNFTRLVDPLVPGVLLFSERFHRAVWNCEVTTQVASWESLLLKLRNGSFYLIEFELETA